MGVIVEATIPVEQFALRDVFQDVPEAEFEFMRVIADCRTGTSFVWGTAETFSQLTAALEAGTTTNDVGVVTELEDAQLYRLEWSPRFRIVVSMLSEADGALLSAHGTDTGWELRFLFPEHQSVSSTHDVCEDYGLDLSIQGVYQLSNVRRGGRSVLTEKQREALVAAYEAGYYAVPRKTSLQELAEQQRISHQALSELLRRGHRAMIRSAIGPHADPVDQDSGRVIGDDTPYGKRRLIGTEL